MQPAQDDLFKELSSAQRILLAEMLWDTVAADANNVPVSDEIRAELDRRLAAKAAGQISYTDWNSIKQRLLGA